MKMKNRNKKITRMAGVMIVLCLLLLTPFVLFAEDTLEVLNNLAGKLAEQRAEIETLSEEISQTRKRYDDEVMSLYTQIADVEVQINREKIRLKMLNQDIAEMRQKIAISQETITDLDPVVSFALKEYRAFVMQSIPFQKEKRLNEIDEIERVLGEGNVDAQTALIRLWNIVQSEYRLTADSGIFRQTIELDGEEQLAEVARLGMVILFFKTFDNRYGYALPEGDGKWKFVETRNGDEIQKLTLLYEGMRRNLKQGFFDIPNPYQYVETKNDGGNS